jgi:hypothetical protein
MSKEGMLTLTSLLCYLRGRLLEARKHNDQESLSQLSRIFEIMEEAAWEANDQKHGALIEDMRLAVGDSFHGVEWKSAIPTEDEIRAASLPSA